MSVLSGSTFRTPSMARGRFARLLVPVAVLAAAGILAFGLRVGATYGTTWWSANHRPIASKTAQMPASSRIEQDWGIRFTVVQLLADNGLVELRYQVLDNPKANRLHADNTSLSNLPTLYVEGTDRVVKSNSLLFHIHHEWDQGSDGRAYSIVYGNAGGALYPRALVTIALPDGLKLQHVPVSG
ncbi:MAG: hypothetical protein M3170_13010 [Candidatus Dormibacteraeota bacterium]|nr:hypothetical protein [Candidatus Dormibacteraeota bacterium]